MFSSSMLGGIVFREEMLGEIGRSKGGTGGKHYLFPFPASNYRGSFWTAKLKESDPQIKEMAAGGGKYTLEVMPRNFQEI